MVIHQISNESTPWPTTSAEAMRPAVPAVADTTASNAEASGSHSSMADQTSPEQTARRVAPIEPGRKVTATQISTPTEMAAAPRFAILKGLVERLTGREVMLVPPGTMILGTRNGPAQAAAADEKSEPAVGLTSVDAVENGRSFRIGTSYGGQSAAPIDVERQVVDLHLGRSNGTNEPLRVEIDSSALEPAPDRPLRVTAGTDDTVRVTAGGPHLDLTV